MDDMQHRSCQTPVLGALEIFSGFILLWIQGFCESMQDSYVDREFALKESRVKINPEELQGPASGSLLTVLRRRQRQMVAAGSSNDQSPVVSPEKSAAQRNYTTTQKLTNVTCRDP